MKPNKITWKISKSVNPQKPVKTLRCLVDGATSWEWFGSGHISIFGDGRLFAFHESSVLGNDHIEYKSFNESDLESVKSWLSKRSLRHFDLIGAISELRELGYTVERS